MKGFKTLEKAVQTFLDFFDWDAVAKLSGEGFFAEIEERIVHFSVLEIESEVNGFMGNLIERCQSAKNMGSFMWSLLHEIGHLETDDLINEYEIFKWEGKKIPLEEYYNLVEERTATNWAIAFYAQHKNELKAWEEILKQAVENFLLDNLTEV